MHSDSQGAERMSDRIFGFALLGLGAIIFWSTFNPDWFSLDDKDEARTVLVPRVLLVLIIVMAALLLVRSFLTATKSAGFSEAVLWQDRMGWVRFAMATAIVLGVAFAMPRIGFYLQWFLALQQWPLQWVCVDGPC